MVLNENLKSDNYRQILDNLPISIILIKDFKIGYLNKHVLNFIEEDSKDIIGANPISFIHQDFQDLAKNKLINFLANKNQPVTYEERLLRRNGNQIDLELGFSLLMLDDEEYVQVIFKDITDRKLLEEKLNNSNKQLENIVAQKTADLQKEVEEKRIVTEALNERDERFRIIFDNTDIGVVLSKPDATFYEVNNAFCKMIGYSKEELLNMTFYDITVSNDLENELSLYNKLVKAETNNYQIEKQYKTKSGNIIWVDLTVSAIRKPNQEVEYFVGVIDEITDKKNIQMELYQSELLNRTIIESSPDCIKLLDLEFKLEFMSDGGQKLFGITSTEQIYGEYYPNFWKGSEYFSAINALNNAIIGQTSTFEGYLPTMNNEPKWWYVTISPIKNSSNQVVKILAISRDITEMKVTEQNIINNERKFRTIFDNSASGLLLVDEELNIIELNKKIISDLKYKSNDLVGKKLDSLIIQSDNFDCKSYLQNPLSDNPKNTNFDCQIPDADKKALWFNFNISRFPYEPSNQIYYIVQLINIDARKLAELEANKFKSAVINSPSTVVITNTKGIIEYVNPKFTESTGYTFEEAIGQNPSIWKSGDQNSDYYESLWKTIASGNIWRGEFLNKKKDGELYWESASISPIKDDNGNVTHFIAIKEDITSKKIYEQTITDNIKFLNILIETIPNPIFYKDNNLRYVGCNHEFENFIGKKREEILGKSVYELNPEEYSKNFDEHDKKLLESGGTEFYESKVLYADGTQRDVIFNKACYHDTEGKVSGIIGIIVDITERKQQELKLQEDEKQLRELNATKDKFFSIISHDLKNPFNVLLTISQMLIEDYNDLSDDEKRKQIQSINQAAKHSYNLLENLLNWSRSQTGSIKFEPEDYDLYELVLNNIYFHRKQAEQKNIEFINNVKMDTIAYFDYNMIDTVIRNLISNAIKFTNQNGKIEINAEIYQDHIMLIVSDNGVGITPENLDKLFKIDKGFSTPGTNKERGTGLGLILCKEFVTKNNGIIQVEGVSNKGAKFSFTLPRL